MLRDYKDANTMVIASGLFQKEIEKNRERGARNRANTGLWTIDSLQHHNVFWPNKELHLGCCFNQLKLDLATIKKKMVHKLSATTKVSHF